MREGCELIVNLKVDKKNLAAHMTKHRDKFFDVIVGKLQECDRLWGRIKCQDSGCFCCPDMKRCLRRYNGLCKMAEGFEVRPETINPKGLLEVV